MRKIDFIELQRNEKGVSVRECITVLLVGLPEEYNIVSTLIKRDATITFNDTVEVLKACEEKLQLVNGSSSSSLTSSTIANMRSNSQSEKKRKETKKQKERKKTNPFM